MFLRFANNTSANMILCSYNVFKFLISLALLIFVIAAGLYVHWALLGQLLATTSFEFFVLFLGTNIEPSMQFSYFASIQVAYGQKLYFGLGLLLAADDILSVWITMQLIVLASRNYQVHNFDLIINPGLYINLAHLICVIVLLVPPCCNKCEPPLDLDYSYTPHHDFIDTSHADVEPTNLRAPSPSIRIL